jgi:ABC-2 type transport system permease protein
MIKRQIFSLIKKEFLSEISYPLVFFSSLITAATTIAIYFFIDKLFGHNIAPHLEEFGVRYFSYVLLSTAFFNYIGVGIGSFSNRIRQEQLQGTFEWLFITPISTGTLLLGLGIWNFLFATLELVIYVAVGACLGAVSFANANIMTAAVFFILSTISFSCLGIMAAGFTVIFKRGNPIAWLFNTLQGLVAGVYFPITVMPKFMVTIANFFPMTPAIRGLELAVYRGYGLTELKKEFIILCAFTLILLFLSPYLFRRAINLARRKGTLAQY